jgi:prevent-host-death family protein
MITVTALEAKNRFGNLLDGVARGEEVVVTRHDKPVARMVPAEGRQLSAVRGAVADSGSSRRESARAHGEGPRSRTKRCGRRSTKAADGASCDDGVPCTDGDACTSGSCSSGAPNDSLCAVGETCTPLGCEPSGGPADCPPTPSPDCLTPALANEAILVLKSAPLKPKLVWRWLKGSATDLATFGDPIESTSYRLCLYTDADGAPQLTTYSVPSGPLWKAVGSAAFKYKDPAGSASGITKLVLKAGADQKAKIQVLGEGPGLAVPSVPADVPIAVELRNGAACWSATFSSTIRNGDGKLKAKAD